MPPASQLSHSSRPHGPGGLTLAYTFSFLSPSLIQARSQQVPGDKVARAGGHLQAAVGRFWLFVGSATFLQQKAELLKKLFASSSGLGTDLLGFPSVFSAPGFWTSLSTQLFSASQTHLLSVSQMRLDAENQSTRDPLLLHNVGNAMFNAPYCSNDHSRQFPISY